MVLIVSEQGLCVLPTVESANPHIWRRDNAFQGLNPTGAPIGSFHMSRLGLASVVDYMAPITNKDPFASSMLVLSLKIAPLLYRSLERCIETLDTVH